MLKIYLKTIVTTKKQKMSMAKLTGNSRDQHAIIIQMSHKTFVEFSTTDVCYVCDNNDFSIDLNGLEYDMQKLANKLRSKNCVPYNNSWRIKLDSLLEDQLSTHLLPIDRLGRK